MADRILIVEDEEKLAGLLRDYLVQDGFDVAVLHRGDQVEDWVRTHPTDLVLLDLMLPGKGGLEVCKALRAAADVSIIMVTARVDEIDRLLGLELGADDYICKPFSPREVVARVKAVLRRSSKSEEHPEEGLRLDKERQYACVGEQCVELTSIEFRILETLLLNKQRVISRDLLLKNAYTDHRVVSDRTMD